MSIRNLFGGAITAELPTGCIDASDFRQVPDTQEVFLYHDSEISIIIEVLERVEPADSYDAAKFHFDSLADDNSDPSPIVEHLSLLVNDRGDKTPSPVILSGTQTVTKFNRAVPDKIRVFLALYRILEKRVDLVLTMNIPIIKAEGNAVGEQGVEAAKADFEAAVRSLQIVSYELFA